MPYSVQHINNDQRPINKQNKLNKKEKEETKEDKK